MKKQNLVSLTACSLLAAATFGSVAHAADNPFAAKPLQDGYQLAQADKKMDGKCGEAKCGADRKGGMEKKKDGKCGEAKCGADKKGMADKKKDGKCGEAKCGADKK
ncbi:hypothetical protein [uncultured Dechloromonas sp.]|uniref:HvfA family oxazolone/thioamide-modified RiPP metallophore n=1 Tax=uncultured Dechloromonas sp. TaxID=171719 RepID=UPI0025CBAB91|nr:hypothetical protein [uncultured Dechloromonas sp.]